MSGNSRQAATKVKEYCDDKTKLRGWLSSVPFYDVNGLKYFDEMLSAGIAAFGVTAEKLGKLKIHVEHIKHFVKKQDYNAFDVKGWTTPSMPKALFKFRNNRKASSSTALVVSGILAAV
jgi:hypothetical protein